MPLSPVNEQAPRSESDASAVTLTQLCVSSPATTPARLVSPPSQSRLCSNTPCHVTPSAPALRPVTQLHRWMQMCLLAMKKLSVLICSLRPEDKSDDGCLPLPSSPTPHPPTTNTIAISLHPRSMGTTEPSRVPGSTGGGGVGGRLQMLLSTGLRVPQTSPDARRPDALQPE